MKAFFNMVEATLTIFGHGSDIELAHKATKNQYQIAEINGDLVISDVRVLRQAEAICYFVAKSFGLDPADNQVDSVSEWSLSREDQLKIFRRELLRMGLSETQILSIIIGQSTVEQEIALLGNPDLMAELALAKRFYM
jgi:hypothetical protein